MKVVPAVDRSRKRLRAALRLRLLIGRLRVVPPSPHEMRSRKASVRSMRRDAAASS